MEKVNITICGNGFLVIYKTNTMEWSYDIFESKTELLTFLNEKLPNFNKSTNELTLMV